MKIKQLLIATCLLIGPTEMFAASNPVYLGGTTSAIECQYLAGSAGYELATFGGYINGIYYWNACFGSFRRGGGSTTHDWYFDVFVSRGADTTQCAEDIEWRVRGTQCRRISGRVDQLECRSTDREAKTDLAYVHCVDSVSGPWSTPRQ